MLDFSTDFGRRAAERLRTEQIVWLTTVGGDGMPQPSPVWFFWDGETALIYSQPHTSKVSNIARHPQAALHLDGDGKGGNIVILTGQAEIATAAPPATEHAAYLAKYDTGLKNIGMTPASFAATYSTAIRVIPTKLRGH